MQHTLHDSLRANVKTGVVNWYSQGLNSYNNAINFVMTFYQEPYEQVVTELLEYQFSQQPLIKNAVFLSLYKKQRLSS